MISSTNEVVLTDLVEIIIEIFVHVLFSFCCFGNDKANGLFVDFGGCHFLPINFALVATDVDAAHGIFIRVFGGAEKPLPEVGGGGYDVVIGNKKIDSSGEEQPNPKDTFVVVSKGTFSPGERILFLLRLRS